MAAVGGSNGNAPKGKDVALTDLKGAADLQGDDAPVIIKPVPVVEAKWSYWNLLTFSWMTNIVSEARKRQISQDELVLPEHLGAEKAFLQFDAAWKEESIKDKPSLLKAVENCYWKDFARAALVKGCWSALLLLAAFLFVRSLVRVVSTGKDEENAARDGWIISVFFFVCCFLLSVCQQQMYRMTQDQGLRLRAALMTAIYRKALKLERAAEEAPDALNLVSNDCSRLMEACTALHSLWSSPIEALAIIILLIALIGYWALIALGMVACLLSLQIWMAKRVAYLRNKTIKSTDLRVRVMAELLTAIKLIKLYAWEDSFFREVQSLRKKEVRYISHITRYKTCNLMSVFAIPPLIAVALFSAYTADTGQLAATIAFTTLSLFNTLRFPLVILPKAIKNLAESRAAISRIQKFLLEPEVAIKGRERMDEVGVIAEDMAVGYVKPALPGVPERIIETLHHCHIRVEEGQKAALVGPVGSGKSSVMLAMLGEARIPHGSIKVGGRIAYVPQFPWIQAGSARDNILFGAPYDEEWYQKVCHACALETDFKILPQGDMTLIAERGINLSGGQRQRLCLARAVYNESDIYLLDNPLSAVDWHTAQHIMQYCVNGLLAEKTVIMATHLIYLLEQFDVVMVVKERTVSYCGPFDPVALRRTLPEFYTDDNSTATNTHDTHQQQPAQQLNRVKSIVPPKDERKRHVRSASQTVLNRVDVPMRRKDSISRRKSLREEDEDNENEESKMTDPTSQNGHPSKLVSQRSNRVIPTKALQREESVRRANEVIKRADTQKEQLEAISSNVKPSYSRSPLSTWLMYAGYAVSAGCGVSMVITQINRIISDWWISQWVKDTFDQSLTWYNVAYVLLVICFVTNLLIRGYTFYSSALKSATLIHNTMYQKVLRAPLAFFSLTPLGRLLNAFSKDQDAVDEGLPDTFHMTCIYGLILATTVIIVCIVIPWYALVGGALLVFTVIMVRYYVHAALSLRHMANATTSPVFSHLSETLRGIAVVRAFQAQERLQNESISLININHKAMFHLDQVSLWLAFRLDIMGALLVFATAILCVAGRDSLGGANAGLAISNSLQALIFYTWMVRGIADIAALLMSVERIQHYIETTPQEADAVLPDHRPKDSWPQDGKITFEDVQMRYFPWLQPALKGVSFSINPREKVGVVGRTGSGKSTLIMALFRMYELDEGRIVVDGEDITNFGLADVRGRMAIIPQEPVMFHGTIRSNLDPFHKFDDDQLWKALEIANLKESIMNLRLQLESPVEDNGENFSLGQRQLMCLARAFLTKSNILLLDEATAAMDLATDSLIQKTIRDHFTQHTIITIAHRLDTIIHCDKILAMDAGRVVEFDSPARLLANPESFFSKLVESAGAAYAESLRRIVAEDEDEKRSAATHADHSADDHDHEAPPSRFVSSNSLGDQHRTMSGRDVTKSPAVRPMGAGAVTTPTMKARNQRLDSITINVDLQ